jgi:hypothetical protein
MPQFSRLEEESKERGFAFLKTDLHAGVTFAEIALAASDPKKVERNRDNARKADQAVRHFMDRVRLTPDEASELKSLQDHLTSLLERLQEKG